MIPHDFNELQALFLSYIKLIGSERSTKKLVLVIDALNQLDNTNHSHTLDWLPEKPPPNVRLIVSTLEGDVYDVLKLRPVSEILVGPLSRQEQGEIVEKTLWVHRKKLSPRQLDLLLQKTDANKPLYLIVACEELRVFGVFENLEDRIRTMSATVPRLFEEVLRRLEGDHDPALVINFLSLLTCSRGGLLETELKLLLGSPEHNEPLPQSTWTKLYRSLQHYLRPPGESGEGVLDFFHQQFPKAVRRLYLSDEAREKVVHTALGNFFWGLGDHERDGSWAEGSYRSLQHVVYHQIKARTWAGLKFSLCNLAFIEAKCEAKMTYDLVSDYLQLNEYRERRKQSGGAAGEDIPEKLGAEISEFQRFVVGRSHVLAHSPSLTFSMALSLPNGSSPSQQAHRRYYEEGVETRPFLDWLNKPQTPNPCVMTLNGHDSIVRCCAHSPDASNPKVVACADDATLKVYNASTGEELLTLKGHKGNLLFCDFSSDGKQIVSGGYGKTVRTWSADSGTMIYEMKGHKGVISSCRFHPRQPHVVISTGRDKTIRTWVHGQPGQCLEAAHEKAILCSAFSPDGNLLATGSEDSTIKIWDTTTWSHLYSLTGHGRSVNSVNFSKDGKHLVSASDDRSAIVWDLATQQIHRKLAGHRDGATWATFNSSGTRVVSCSHDNLIYLWETRTGKEMALYIGHTGSIFRCEFSPDEKFIISCSFDRYVGEENEILNFIANYSYSFYFLNLKIFGFELFLI
jgi:telomerase protein component 1